MELKTIPALACVLLASCSSPGQVAPEPGVAPATSAQVSTDPSRLTHSRPVDIEALERVYQATPKNAAERPSLAWRLAEAYVQLEEAWLRSKTVHAVRRDEAREAGDSPREQAEAAAEAKAASLTDVARRKAIEVYSLLASEYPLWCQGVGGHGCGDEVLFYLAYEHEQAGQPGEARRVYQALIKGFPQSRYAPNAYLAFAEDLYTQALTDPTKLALAEKAYLEVLRYPPPDNKWACYAHYKLAYVYWNRSYGNRSDFPRVLSEMTKTIEASVAYFAPNADQLAKEARRELPGLYAIVGDPGKAYDFLAQWSGDPPGHNAGLHRMLDLVAQAYLDRGEPSSAVAVYLDWLRHGAGAQACDVVKHIDTTLAGMGASGAKHQAAAAASAPLKAARAQCPATP